MKPFQVSVVLFMLVTCVIVQEAEPSPFTTMLYWTTLAWLCAQQIGVTSIIKHRTSADAMARDFILNIA
jgi:hypothetical protein